MPKAKRRVFKRRGIRRRKYPMYKSVSPLSFSIKCESYGTFQAQANNPEVRFSQNSQYYLNTREAISSSVTFTKYKTLFKRMRIDAISIVACHVPSNTSNFDVMVAFHPNYTSTSTLADEMRGDDSILLLQPGNYAPVSKTWRFIKGYLQGPEGTGYGVIYPITTVTMNILPGQLTVAPAISIGTPSATVVLYTLRVQYFITLFDPET